MGTLIVGALVALVAFGVGFIVGRGQRVTLHAVRDEVTAEVANIRHYIDTHVFNQK